MKKPDEPSNVFDEDKDDILMMIDFGWSDEDILQMLPHVYRASVTAYRAHVTRGTYQEGVSHGGKECRIVR